MNEQLAREIETWPARIEAAMARCGAHLRDYIIISRTGSTQDTARQLHAPPGAAVIAAEQTAGRGRFGRTWTGEPAQGTYVTIVLPWHDASRLAIAAAVGVVDALRDITFNSIDFGIKWPNDVLARNNYSESETTGIFDGWRKLSGILIEQADDRALIGIGINVTQSNWGDDLKCRAVSLHQLGLSINRIAVIEALLPALDHALSLDASRLAQRFLELDVMTGRRCAFTSAGLAFTGEIASIDPQHGLLVRLDGDIEPTWFAADSTTLHDPIPAG